MTCLLGSGRGEKHAFSHGRYNLILAGAAFMPASFLALFSSPELAAMRDMVDQQINGEDLLLNFAVAAGCNATQPCIQVCSSHGCMCATVHVGKAALGGSRESCRVD